MGKFADAILSPEPQAPRELGRFSRALLGKGEPEQVPEGAIVHTDGRSITTPEDERAHFKEMEARKRAEGLGGLRSLAPVAQGLSFGSSDELVGAFAAPFTSLRSGNPLSDEFDINRDAMRFALEQEREENPVGSMVGEIAGAIPTALIPMGALGRMAQGSSLAGRVAGGAGIGALQGGIYGFNTGEGVEDRLKSAGQTGAVGGAIGAAAPYAGAAGRKIAQKLARSQAGRAALKVAENTEKLRQQAHKAYDRVREAGVVVKPEKFQKFAGSLSGKLKEEGLDPTLHQKGTAIMRRLSEAADDPSQAPNITTMRRLAKSVADSADPDEARIGRIMLDRFDDFIENLTPQDLSGGNIEGVAGSLKQARELWGRMRRTELIEDAFERAGRQASGMENGLRIAFRSILNNKRLRRGFSKGEIDAMQKVVSGTPGANIAKKVGKFGFGSGQQSNALGGMIGGGAGAALGSSIGGPGGAAAGGVLIPGIGYVSQRVAQALTTRNARLAQALIGSGGLRNLPAPNPQFERLAQILAQRNVPVTGPAMTRR